AGRGHTGAALLQTPAPPATPGGFDFQRVAFFDRLGGVGFALAPAQRVATADATGLGLMLARLRQDIITAARASLPGAEGAVAAALLTGQRQAIPPTVMEDLRRSGLAHLLAVSGLHVGIVAGLAFVLVRLALGLWPGALLRLPVKKIAALCGIAAGFGYMLLTGSQVPMRRALAMAALLALAVLVDRRGSALRALAIAAAVVLLLQPEALLGPSFQMSFAAVLALVAAWEALRRSWLSPRRDRGLLERGAVAFAALLVTSLVASAATTPFVAFHFQRIQIYGVAANALAVPLTSLWIMPWGMLALLLMPIGLHDLAFAPMGAGIAAVIWVAGAVSSWPLASPTLPAMPGWGVALCGLGLCALCLLRGRGRLAGLVAILAGFGSAWMVPQPDILLSADGRQLALRAEGALHRIAVGGADRFTTEQWSARAGGLPVLPLQPGPTAPAILRCEDRACVLGEAAAPRGVILLDGAATDWCGRTPLIVSLDPVRGRCWGTRVVDRSAVWRGGAHAVWLDGPTVASDSLWRGNRPWVVLPRQRWRDDQGEAPARIRARD
ncbi:MAG: ComEC/Rec2 family competence protein, partial [Acetobacteraceae bacterium]